MTDKEILEKAIHKAIDGGWDIVDYTSSKDKHKIFNRDFEVREDGGIYSKGPYRCMECGKPDYTVEEIIFNHSFAKALWGNNFMFVEQHNTTPIGGIARLKLPVWQVHLQQMVISDDPIDYLGENL